MKAHYRTSNGRLTFELEGSVKEIFEGIAGIQEVFEADSACGCCGKPNLRFRVRTTEEFQFFEWICMDCRAVLAFGEMKQGGKLYAKRKSGEKFLPDRGWALWHSPDHVGHTRRNSVA